MGATTPKGLRYPEPSTEARVMPARMQDLATDIDGVLTTHDTRLGSLDTKTNNTNTAVATKRVVQASASGQLSRQLNSANDWVERTVYLGNNILFIPNTTAYSSIYVSMSVSAHCAANAAVYWKPVVSLNNGGFWQSLSGATDLLSHNQNNPAVDLGFFVAGTFDVAASRGNYIALACNNVVDAGSGAWIDNGYYLHYRITAFG